MLLQAGNMRNVAPYEGNPVLEFLLSFKPIGMIIGFFIAIFLIFMLIHFVANVIPELLGQKTLLDHIEKSKIKTSLEEKDVIKIREERIRPQNIQHQERLENLKNRAEVEVARRGATEKKWQKQIDDFFSKPPFSEWDEKTIEKLKASMKNGYKEHNQKIYDDYIKNNQYMLIDISEHFNQKR